MRVLLVCMPWLGLHLPSLALSTLAPLGRGVPHVDRLDVRYANIEWADYVLAATEGRIGSTEYMEVSENAFSGLGEWVFSGALYGISTPELTDYHQQMLAGGHDMVKASEMYRLAADFVEWLSDDVSCGSYDVVGFTSTFVQNVPSLALAQAVKKKQPEVTVVFGGANCDGPQGATMHRNFPFIDYVVRGEAELVFPMLLRHLAGDPDVELGAIDGLCWWNGTRPAGEASVANRMAAGGVNAEIFPEPTYDEYFATFERSAVCVDVRPRIVLEGSRGCWWGQKHHCTFCGLNNSLMAFRAKEPDRMLTEIKRAVTRHRTLDVVFADNILDQRYIRELLPRLGDLGWDLQIFFEVKSNQVFTQLERMSSAGVVSVQPGIESFSTKVLKLMRKGVTGWQNVRFLRDCRTLGIDPMWNLLYGFPGEVDDDYLPMIDQLPDLIHLKAPQEASRVSLTRFSPFFDDPSLGMKNLGPARFYAQIYDLPISEIADLVYLFQSPDTGVTAPLVERMETAVATWLGARERSLVALCDHHAGTCDGSGLTVVDERDPHRRVEYDLSPSVAAVYRALLKGHSLAALNNLLAADPLAPAPDEIGELLTEWHNQGLVYRDGDTYVALATGLAYR